MSENDPNCICPVQFLTKIPGAWPDPECPVHSHCSPSVADARECYCNPGECYQATWPDATLAEGVRCKRGAEAPVPGDLTIGEAQRRERERQEDAIREGSNETGSAHDIDKDFVTTGTIRIYLGFNDEGKQQVRFAWDDGVTTTQVIGACEFLSAFAKAALLSQ